MQVIKYDLADAILGNGVNTHPLTQMLALGFEVQKYEYKPQKGCYLFTVCGTPWEMPSYLRDVTVRSKPVKAVPAVSEVVRLIA